MVGPVTEASGRDVVHHSRVEGCTHMSPVGPSRWPESLLVLRGLSVPVCPGPVLSVASGSIPLIGRWGRKPPDSWKGREVPGGNPTGLGGLGDPGIEVLGWGDAEVRCPLPEPSAGWERCRAGSAWGS